MARKRLTEAEIERGQVEQVFLLTGGELNDPSEMTAWYRDDGSEATRTIPYQYDGPPEYAAEDFDEIDTHELFTVVAYRVAPAPILVDGHGGIWLEVAHWTSSGETPCPFRDWDPDTQESAEMGQTFKVARSVSQLTAKPPLRYDRPRWYGDKRPNARHAECTFCGERVGQEHGYIDLGDGWAESVYARVGYVRGKGEDE